MTEKYTLYNCENITKTVQLPIKSSNRVKFLAVNASEKYLVFGANSGSCYVFNREPCYFLYLIPTSLKSEVKHLKISKQEKLVAFSNVKGHIGIANLNTDDYHVQITHLKDDHYVTEFYWDTEVRLFCGDQKGSVWIITPKNLTPRHILALDSPVVQIAGHRDLLLVSTFAKSILCRTDAYEFKPIGCKLRDGDYGATFHSITDGFGELTRIYCARPGFRLWEVDLEGDVKNTHQLKSGVAIPPTNIIPKSHLENGNEKSSEDSPSNTFHFTKLLNFMDGFIITYTDSKFYILDPPSAKVQLWSHFTNIHTLCVVKSTIIIFTMEGKTFTIEFGTLQDYVLKLFQAGQFVESADIIRGHMDYFRSIVKKKREYHQLYKLRESLEGINQNQKAKDLQTFFDDIFTHSHEMVQSSMRFSNGIYIIDNQYSNLNCKVIDRTNETANAAGIKNVLDAYGKNFKDMFKGLKTLNLDTGYLSSSNDKSSTSEPKKSPNDSSKQETDVRTTIPSETVPSNTMLEDANYDQQMNSITKQVYLIFKTSKISNLNFLDRYAALFDRYDTRGIIELLKRLEQMIVDNVEDVDVEVKAKETIEQEAKSDCIKMYFDYLNPEIIYELDEDSLIFIKNSFIHLNKTSEPILRCNQCQFPLQVVKTPCKFRKIGVELLKYFWSRNSHEVCFEIAHNVPSQMIETMCKFYIKEKNIAKMTLYVMALGSSDLLQQAADHYNTDAWRHTYETLCTLILHQTINCLKCDIINSVPASFYNANLFYTFNHITETVSNYLNSRVLLELLKIYSDKIPNGALDQSIFLKILFNS